MWQCPVCGQTFVTRNMPHSRQVVELDDHLRAHLVLKRPIDHPRLAVEHLGPDDYLHRFALTGPADVDDELKAWIAEAYRTGAQLTRSRPPAAPPAPDRPKPGTR